MRQNLNVYLAYKSEIGNVIQIKIKNHTYYFFNGMINVKKFHPSLIKIDKKSYTNLGIYHIGYIKIKKLVTMKILIV